MSICVTAILGYLQQTIENGGHCVCLDSYKKFIPHYYDVVICNNNICKTWYTLSIKDMIKKYAFLIIELLIYISVSQSVTPIGNFCS